MVALTCEALFPQTKSVQVRGDYHWSKRPHRACPTTTTTSTTTRHGHEKVPGDHGERTARRHEAVSCHSPPPPPPGNITTTTAERRTPLLLSLPVQGVDDHHPIGLVDVHEAVDPTMGIVRGGWDGTGDHLGEGGGLGASNRERERQ